MNLFNRIAIGTANWGHEYNGARVPDEDQKKILGYAQIEGIDMIDTATAYGWNWMKANSFFNVVVKVRSTKEIEDVAETDPYCIMAHNEDDWRLAFDIRRALGSLHTARTGISVYESNCGQRAYMSNEQQYPGRFLMPKIIQCPYSLYDRRFGQLFPEWIMTGVKIHVRSIFLRGKILKEASPQECIQFCLCNPNVDKVIVGADSFEQFRDNLRFLHKWKNLEKHDLKLLDTRQW